MPGVSGFIPVTNRRRRRNAQRTVQQNIYFPVGDVEEAEIDCEELLRTVFSAAIRLRASPFKTTFFDCLTQSLNCLDINTIPEIVCYGLGRFSNTRIARFQLALLLALKARFNCPVHVYDPIFHEKEIEVLKILGLSIIENNEEGKRQVQDKPTLLFMPHCSIQLTNNFLYANWGENLSNCIIVANSFTEIVEHSIDRVLANQAGYIVRILPYTTEIPIENNFEFDDVFNSCHIHIFTKDSLNRVPVGFWDQREEPHYRERIEFIVAERGDTAEMNPNLKIIRSLVKEVRQTAHEKKMKDNIVVQYILEQARAHKQTSEVLCKAREELKNLGETYLCYLSSLRKYKDIRTEYAGKGERSIKETADLVGFKLPHDPK